MKTINSSLKKHILLDNGKKVISVKSFTELFCIRPTFLTQKINSNIENFPNNDFYQLNTEYVLTVNGVYKAASLFSENINKALLNELCILMKPIKPSIEPVKELINPEPYTDKIFEVRGIMVMLDSDIADLLDVETGHLNRAIKRNLTKFSENEYFQLQKEENYKMPKCHLYENQSLTYNHHVLSREGVYKAASCLKNPIAQEVVNRIFETNGKLEDIIKAPTTEYSTEVPTSFSDALYLAACQQKKIENDAKIIEQQNMQLIEQAPKVEAYMQLMDSTGTVSVLKAGDFLGLGQKTLFKLLRDKKILMKDNVPYRRYIESGYFTTKITTLSTNRVYSQTFITPKGVVWIRDLIKTSHSLAYPLSL